MKESYREGVANHPDPESCGTRRKAGLEAFDRGTCGLSIELRERFGMERRRCLTKRKAIWTGSETREPGQLCGVGDLMHAWKLNAREWRDFALRIRDKSRVR